jgi:biotin operon repressor
MSPTKRGTAGARRDASGPVSIALSGAQVEAVLRDANPTDHISMLLSGLPDLRELHGLIREQKQDPRLSTSLIFGLMLLVALPADGRYTSLTALARSLEMSVSTAHRYVSTLHSVGLVERHEQTRQYRLAHVD